jgi:hypothetical protein
MSIRGWFAKKMMAAMREVNEAESSLRPATDMERMFGNCSPSIVAFRIENGFVVRTISQQELYEGSRVGGGFTYCKDHTEIAEHIVASEVKRKLVGEQQEMFGQSIPAMLQKNAAITSRVGSGGVSNTAKNRI